MEEAVKSAQEAVFYADPEPYRQRAFQVIEQLERPPSVVVDTGGGFHAYWLFAAAKLLAGDADSVGEALAAWVGLVGADTGAADLARVLRLPGLRNRKAEWRGEPPRVAYVRADFELLYEYDELAGAALAWQRAQPKPAHPKQARPRLRQMQAQASSKTVQPLFLGRPWERPTVQEQRVIDAYNRRHAIRTMLRRYGYEERGRRFVRPGGRSASVEVDDIANRSWHWSSRDPVYAANAAGKPRATTPFTLHMVYEHDGDLRKAVAAARRLLYQISRKGTHYD